MRLMGLCAIAVLIVGLPLLGGCVTTPKPDIDCSQSALQYSAIPFGAGKVLRCVREVIAPDEWTNSTIDDDELRYAIRDAGRAFQPEGSLTYSTGLMGVDGQWAQIYLAIAPGNAHFNKPDLRSAVAGENHIKSLLHIHFAVDWGQQIDVDGYDIQFYQETSSLRPGVTACMTFVNYLGGLPDDHARRISGLYCDSKLAALDVEAAKAILGAIQLHDELIKWQLPPEGAAP